MKPLLPVVSILCLCGQVLAQDTAPTPIRVTEGPILGRPAPDSMTLWVRTERQGEVEEVLSLMEKYKSIAYAQERSKALVDKACAQFNQRFAHLLDSRAKSLFLPLVNFVIEREY